MGLPHILYPAPAEDGWEQWLLNNYVQHRAINDATAAQFGITVNQYQIYPVLPENLNDFLQQHQRWHNDMNASLGIPGNDLSSVDFQDEKQMDAWMFLHYQEHLAAVTTLGGGL